MRLNVNGYLTLRLAFNTSVHAPEKAPTDVLVHRVKEKLARDVGELLEATGFGDDDVMPSELGCGDLMALAHEGMAHMEIRVEGREHGDPAECDCSVCQRPCRHEPDRTTLRVCAPDCVEVQCKLCGEWGSHAIDVGSLAFGDGAWMPPVTPVVDAKDPRPDSAVQRGLRHMARMVGEIDASDMFDADDPEHAGGWEDVQRAVEYIERSHLPTEREMVAAARAEEPSIQTCACCNLVQPYTNTLCIDCGHDLRDPEGCECEACKINHDEEVATGQTCPTESESTCPKCGSDSSTVSATGYTRTCNDCCCAWAIKFEPVGPADTSTLPGVQDACKGSDNGCSCGGPECDADDRARSIATALERVQSRDDYEREQGVCPECLALPMLEGHKTCGRYACVDAWQAKRDVRVAQDLAAHTSSSK